MADLASRTSTISISAAGSTYTAIGGVKTIDFGGSVDKEDKTDHDSGSAKESAPGRSEFTMSIGGNYDETDVGQDLLRTAFFAKSTYYFKYRPAGAVTGAKEAYAQGYVTSYKAPAANDGYIQFTAEIQLTGSVTWAAQS